MMHRIHKSGKRSSIAIFLTALFIIIVMLPQPQTAVQAADDAAEQLRIANILKSLGLFMGTDIGFELERAPIRTEGAILLVRLLGMEKFSKSQSIKHPYTDVPYWGDAYIGYMHEAGLTKGIGSGLYGAYEQLQFQHMVVFLLRSLHYYEDTGDFTYGTAIQKAVSIGLMNQTTADYLNAKAEFTRGDTVILLYNALKLKLKGTNDKLISILVEFYDAVSASAAVNSGLYQQTAQFPKTSLGYKVSSRQQVADIITYSVVRYITEIKFDTTSYPGTLSSEIKGIFDGAYEIASDLYHVGNYISSIYYVQDGKTFTLRFEYGLARPTFVLRLQQMELAYIKTARVVSEITSSSMSEYQKELAIHDYIVTNTAYDSEGYEKGAIPWESNTAYGALILDKAVCGGYSEAAKVLCELAGLQCVIVYGTATTGSAWYGHAWNIVRISGRYYHLDVTYDDPIGGGATNRIIHDYFNLPDSLIQSDHNWDASKYPSCTSMESNYFYINDCLAPNYDGFAQIINSAVQQKAPEIEIMVQIYNLSDYNNISGIMFADNEVSGYSARKNDLLGVIGIYNIKYR